MKTIQKIIKFFTPKHRCRYNTPILSVYLSFNSRKIIYQCRCGNKKADIEVLPFGVDFPIPTCNSVSDNEFKTVLYSKEVFQKPLTTWLELYLILNPQENNLK